MTEHDRQMRLLRDSATSTGRMGLVVAWLRSFLPVHTRGGTTLGRMGPASAELNDLMHDRRKA